MSKIGRRTLVPGLVLLLGACASGGGTSPDLTTRVVTGYADGALATYEASADAARALDDAVDDFAAEPSGDTFRGARTAWEQARGAFMATVAFRDAGGPVDAGDAEVLDDVDAWPVDAAHVDPDASGSTGLVGDREALPEVTEAALREAHQPGDGRPALGFHVLELLLWGEDDSTTEPGQRTFEAYTDAPDAERRTTWLVTATDLLVDDLELLVDDWAVNRTGNAREAFLALSTEDALARIVDGAASSAREIGEQWLARPLEAGDDALEPSRFADTTTDDVSAALGGIATVLAGGYPDVTDAAGVLTLVGEEDEGLSRGLEEEARTAVADASAIPAPFDQHLAEDVPADDAGRGEVEATIEAITTWADGIDAAAAALGVDR